MPALLPTLILSYRKIMILTFKSTFVVNIFMFSLTLKGIFYKTTYYPALNIHWLYGNKRKLKTHTYTSAIPFVVVSFHSNSFSIITITLKQEIYYSPSVFTASDTRLIDKYGI